MENIDLGGLNLDAETLDSSIELFTIYGMSALSALAILIAGWVIGNRLKKMIGNIKKLDNTLKSFLGNLAKYIVMAVSLVAVLGQFGIETASLLALLGAAGLAIGLALQGTLSNVAAGVMMLILRPFGVGDYIEAAGIGATVKELGLFTTQLSTPDNVFVSVPNSQIWNSNIRNFSRNKQRRQDIVFGISYDDDINKAIKTVQGVLKKDKRLVTTEGKEPQVMVTGMGDSSVDLIARVWCDNADFWDVKWDLTKGVKEALDRDGLTIPYPTRTIEYADSSVAAANTSKPSKKKAA